MIADGDQKSETDILFDRLDSSYQFSSVIFRVPIFQNQNIKNGTDNCAMDRIIKQI